MCSGNVLFRERILNLSVGRRAYHAGDVRLALRVADIISNWMPNRIMALAIAGNAGTAHDGILPRHIRSGHAA
jgi:hypothetical protein